MHPLTTHQGHSPADELKRCSMVMSRCYRLASDEMAIEMRIRGTVYS